MAVPSATASSIVATVTGGNLAGPATGLDAQQGDHSVVVRMASLASRGEDTTNLSTAEDPCGLAIHGPRPSVAQKQQATSFRFRVIVASRG